MRHTASQRIQPPKHIWHVFFFFFSDWEFSINKFEQNTIDLMEWRGKQQQQKHIRQAGRDQRSKKPMINMFAWKVDMANRTTQKSISSQACKLCPMFYAYRNLQVKFSFSAQFISAGLFYNMAALLTRKILNWFSSQFCTIVLVWEIWLFSLAPWKNLKRKDQVH